MHCGIPTQADLRKCPHKDLQVHLQRSSLDVHSIKPNLLGENPLDVVAHAVLGGQDFGLIGESKLRKAGDTRPHLQNLCICVGMQADERRILRSRPDEAHASAQDVPQLRDLVKLRSCKQAADPREAIVVRSGEGRPGSLHMHLPELQHGERASIPADAAAADEDGTTAVEFHNERDQSDQRAQHDERDYPDHDVENALPLEGGQRLAQAP